MSSESASDLDEQWNDLMDEYTPNKGKVPLQNEDVLKPRSKNKDKGFYSQQTAEL